MANTPGTLRYPTLLDDADSLIIAANNASTTLTQPLDAITGTINVAATGSFPSTGALTVDGEIIFYTGKGPTTFTGCVRGRDGTSAAAHIVGATAEMRIIAAHHNLLSSAVVALESKTGAGSSTPLTNTFLRGTGSGTSEWATIPSYLELNLAGAGPVVTLSAEQCRQPRIILMGPLASDVTVEFLNLHQIWTVEDITTRSGFKIFIRKTGGSSKELYPGEIADFRASGS